MPSIEALDAMALTIAGVRWDDLTFPEHRVQVMQLALAEERNGILDATEGHLSDLLEQAVHANKHLDTLTDQMEEAAKWFEHSKVWSGEAYVRSS